MTGMRILAYTVMPNHWHLLLYTKEDGDMGTFMHWLANAHTRRVHALTETIGTGPLYQGRYKSFIAESDTHLLTVLKYIERNPVRAKLSKTPQEWKWGSAWLRTRGTGKQKKLLADCPTPLPRNYDQWIRTVDSPNELESLRESVRRGALFGGTMWVEQMLKKHEILASTVRDPWRPKGS